MYTICVYSFIMYWVRSGQGRRMDAQTQKMYLSLEIEQKSAVAKSKKTS